MEIYPSLAFDSLFENRGTLRNRSILDRVKEHAESLGRQVSASDKTKLDEYLTSVREVEKQVDRMRSAAAKAEDRARDKGQPAITMDRPDNGLPEDIREHMRLMCDIIALAFQTDKTRIATLLLCRDISGLFYPFLDVRSAHHPASHRDHSEDYLRIVRYYVSQVAYLADKLQAMPEGDGNVLDNSLLMWSAISAARCKPAACSTTPTRGTRTANCAACTSRSWTGWASSSTASATPTRGWPIYSLARYSTTAERVVCHARVPPRACSTAPGDRLTWLTGICGPA
jgi:hypothetical protein